MATSSFWAKTISLCVLLAACGDSTTTTTDAAAAPDMTTTATGDLATTPDLATPDLATPDLSMPDLSMPDLSMPDLSMPDLSMPDLSMPDLSMPDLSMPDLSMPDLHRPPGTIAFTAFKTYPTAGGQANRIVGADFNNDGVLDLATADGASSVVSILLGKGDGSFGAATTTLSVGQSPFDLAAADLDGDHNVDVVVTNKNAGTITTFLGKGDGTFAAPQATIVSNPGPIALGDLDGDGKPDLVYGYGINAMIIATALGKGDGTFAMPATQALMPGEPLGRSLVLADFDGDGHRDVAVPSGTGQGPAVAILLGKGNGTLGAPTYAVVPAEGGYVEGIALGDLDHDGKLDLAADTGNGAADGLLGHGDGTFTGVTTMLSFGITVAPPGLGDFDDDGFPDFVDDVDLPSGMAVARGKGDGTFGVPTPVMLSSFARCFYVADFNRDGLLDIAAGTQAGIDVVLGK